MRSQNVGRVKKPSTPSNSAKPRKPMKKLCLAVIVLFSSLSLSGCYEALANVERGLTGAAEIQKELDEVADKLLDVVDVAKARYAEFEPAVDVACRLYPDTETCDLLQSQLADLKRQMDVADEKITLYRKTGLRFNDALAAATNCTKLAGEMLGMLEDLRQGSM